MNHAYLMLDRSQNGDHINPLTEEMLSVLR